MLEVRSVNRRFGDRAVLRNVSFTVGPGRLTGFVGANGAGKTTTMRIILGVLAADSGEIYWQGGLLKAPDRRRFGYMPEERGLYPKMKVAEQIQYFGRLHGMSAPDARIATGQLLDRLSLGERAKDAVETLSLGNQQRAQIAAALVHHPVALILDEPFSGLDPLVVDAVAEVVRERAQTGVPVLFSSHQLDLVERLCDDVVIIANGRVRAAGSREELRRSRSRPHFELVVEPDAGWLLSEPGVTVLDLDGPRAVVELAAPDLDQWLLGTALAHGTVRAFAPVLPTLAEIFREVVGEEVADDRQPVGR